MKYTAEMASGGTIYILSFIMIGSESFGGRGGDTHTDIHRQQHDLMSLLLF
jgi:hypothetical protein